MSTSLRTLCFNIWKSKLERQGISSEYKPFFSRYIGVDNIDEYPSILKTLLENSKNCPYSIFFDRSIPMQAEFEIITYIGSELKTMDVTNLKEQDIVLFENQDVNKLFLLALDKTVNLAVKQESFFNQSARNDFILKLIVWTYSYVRTISQSFDPNYSPKCFYYGDITKHEMYFLIMLHWMNFDVIVLNPLRDDEWKNVDTLNLCEKVSSQYIMPISSVTELTKDANIIEQDESITLQLQREMENTLFSGTGVYRAWQFRDGNTKSMFIRATIYDLLNSYLEPARVRNGFKVNQKTVTIPNYFFQIDGVYNDVSEYQKLVTMCVNAPNTLVLTNCGETLISGEVDDASKLKLAFCRLGDGSYDISEIKKLSFYKWDKYRDTLEDFMLNKINELFKDCMFKKKLTEGEQFNLIADILMMDESIIKMTDNFDYTDKIPKLVLFLNNEDSIQERILYLIGFIVELSFDVIIFSPSGLISIDSVFEINRFNSERLDIMKYDYKYEDAIKKKKTKNFLQKIFS